MIGCAIWENVYAGETGIRFIVAPHYAYAIWNAATSVQDREPPEPLFPQRQRYVVHEPETDGVQAECSVCGKPRSQCDHNRETPYR